jgi:hypothetical protein
MTKLITKALLIILFAVNLGCQKEDIEPVLSGSETEEADSQKKPNDICPEYFYYYGQTKIDLGAVNTSQIIIGFQNGITSEQKAAFISQYPYLQSIKSEFNTGSADATVITLKEGITCAEVEAAFIQLAKQPEVRYATPFYQSPFDTNLLGITNQFIVNLKPGYTVEDLQILTKRTKTEIVEQLGDITFIMSADKYATGNALQMANEFAGFYQIDSSEPDFYYSY